MAGTDPHAATLASSVATAAPGSDPHADTVAGSEAPPLEATPGGPADGASLVGRQLAHYRVEKRLGRGGMGEVYLATDLALDRPVALKIIGGAVASDPELRQRFLREARAQARIQHPNVCHIYYIGEAEGQLFFAMEYIEGVSLQARLERDTKIPAGEAVELCRQAALGLREAQRHGFTHRDVKPSNLMVDRHGALKVVDFGLVKQAGGGGADGGGAALTDAGLTGGSAPRLLGPPLYIAPEQAKGERVDFRADVYSLGCTLHHLVAGVPPFEADSTFALVARHLGDPRPRLEPRAGHFRDSPLDALCDRMTAKRAADRFASYDDLLAALERLSPARTRPAGVWVRAFALALDAVVAMLLSLPLALLLPRLGSIALAATAAVYSVLAHARWGRTLGKLALDIEVVPAHHAGRLGLRTALLRWAVQWGPTYAALLALAGFDRVKGGLGNAAQLLIAAPLVVLAALPPPLLAVRAALRADKLTLWDAVARTQVVYRRSR
jgi:uncharacterized RDD family membrane protein YckC